MKIEIDKHRTPDMSDETLAEQAKLLDTYCQRTFDAILKSLHEIPLDLMRIAHYLTTQTRKKWPDPDAVQGAVAGFIFLRFFWFVTLQSLVDYINIFQSVHCLARVV